MSLFASLLSKGKRSVEFSAKATASAAKTVTAAIPKQKPPLKRQFSTLSMHSHRLSLAGASETSANQLEEHEKPYDAPMMRIFGLNKPEWPYNIIGNDHVTVNSRNAILSLEKEKGEGWGE